MIRLKKFDEVFNEISAFWFGANWFATMLLDSVKQQQQQKNIKYCNLQYQLERSPNLYRTVSTASASSSSHDPLLIDIFKCFPLQCYHNTQTRRPSELFFFSYIALSLEPVATDTLDLFRSLMMSSSYEHEHSQHTHTFFSPRNSRCSCRIGNN